MVKNKGPVLVERDWLQKILLDWYTIKSLEVSQAPPIARERLQTMLDKYSMFLKINLEHSNRLRQN